MTQKERAWHRKLLCTATWVVVPAIKPWSISCRKVYPFIEKNVAREPGAMQDLVRLGLRLLPVLGIGDQRLSGFHPKEIDAALAG